MACNFIKNEFFRIYYPKIVATDTDKPFSYLQRNFFVGHLPDKGFYNELVTAFYNKKRKILNIHGFESTWDLLNQSSGKILRSSPSEVFLENNSSKIFKM